MKSFEEIAKSVLQRAERHEQVEVVLSRGTEVEVAAYAGEVESLTTAESVGLGVRVIRDHQTGFASAGTLDDTAVENLLDEARSNAAVSDADEFAGLAEPDGMPPCTLDLVDVELAAVPLEKKVAAALDLERRTKVRDARISAVERAEYGDYRGESLIATSTGIWAESESTTGYLTVGVLATQGSETQTGWGYAIGRGFHDLDFEEASSDAVNRATELLGSTQPKSTRTTIIFDMDTSPAIYGALASAVNGENVAKGRSFFQGRLDEAVAVTGFTLRDDPTDARAYGACIYDGEGLATRRNTLIDGGILRDLLCDTYAAKRLGRRSNGAASRPGFRGGPSAGARAIVVDPGEQTLEELVADVPQGILIRSLLGVGTGGINTVNGSVSLGATGIAIEDGELAGPLREFTIASTLQEMLMGIVAIGSEVHWRAGSVAGVPVVIREMAVSGS